MGERNGAHVGCCIPDKWRLTDLDENRRRASETGNGRGPLGLRSFLSGSRLSFLSIRTYADRNRERAGTGASSKKPAVKSAILQYCGRYTGKSYVQRFPLAIRYGFWRCYILVLYEGNSPS